MQSRQPVAVLYLVPFKGCVCEWVDGITRYAHNGIICCSPLWVFEGLRQQARAESCRYLQARELSFKQHLIDLVYNSGVL